MGWYKVATDLGSLISGILALIAGVIAYLAGLRQARETRQAMDRQLAATAEKDHLRARCIALGIVPEPPRLPLDR